jgi:hypothetical protein
MAGLDFLGMVLNAMNLGKKISRLGLPNFTVKTAIIWKRFKNKINSGMLDPKNPKR